MPSNSIPHYLYKRNHTWWFKKRFVSEGNAIEYRLSLQTASFQRASLTEQRLKTPNALRYIPLHKCLIDLGLLASLRISKL